MSIFLELMRSGDRSSTVFSTRFTLSIRKGTSAAMAKTAGMYRHTFFGLRKGSMIACPAINAVERDAAQI